MDAGASLRRVMGRPRPPTGASAISIVVPVQRGLGMHFSRDAHYSAHVTTTTLPPFHLALPVHDIKAARRFYGDVLGFSRGRSAERWTDWNVEGHQVVTHQVDDHKVAVAGTNPVDGHDVPVPHFGLVLDVDRFQELARRLTDAGMDFVIEP